ncbi:MAG: hypothetical protein RL226_2140 [Bacteroidota bacterium]|jgi:hypothetical protein
MKHTLFAIALATLVLAGCKKKTDYEAIDFGYDYFPTEIGTFVEYEVDSISYGEVNDTSHFYLREVIADDFIDNERQMALKVERYKRTNLTDEWELTDVWVQKRTTTTAERIEENIRYIRLVFPMEQGDSWDGNVYNTDAPWQYAYGSLNIPYQVDNLSFNETVKVEQRNNINLIDQEEAWEVYARGVGLIEKRLLDLTYQNLEITGVFVHMRAINYGTE